MDTTSTPTLTTKINRLFATFHTKNQPEQTDEVVARSVSTILGRIVAVHTIARLRAGAEPRDLDSDPPELLTAVAQHFKVPVEYLLEDGPVAAGIDRELRLLSAARDARVKSIALRGSVPDSDALTRELARLTLDSGAL